MNVINIFAPSLVFSAVGTGKSGPDLFALNADGTLMPLALNGGATSNAGEDGGYFAFNGKLYFFADTSAGTARLLTLNANGTVSAVTGVSAQPNAVSTTLPAVNAHFTLFDGRMFFAANGSSGSDIYTIDSTGTVTAVPKDLLFDFPVEAGDGNTGFNNDFGFTFFNGSLYFNAFDKAHAQPVLFRIAAGSNAPVAMDTQMVATYAGEDGGLVVYNNTLLFNAYDFGNSDFLYMLAAGATAPVKVTDTGGQTIGHTFLSSTNFYQYDPAGGLFFIALDASNTEVLYADQSGSIAVVKTGGVAYSGASLHNGFIGFNNYLYFSANGHLNKLSLAANSVATIAGVDATAGEHGGFFNFNNKLYFFAESGGKAQLYTLDAADHLTAVAGVTGSLSVDAHYTVFNGSLYLAGPSTQGTEVIEIDAAGTVHVHDVNSGGSSNPGAVGGFVVYTPPPANGTSGDDQINGSTSADDIDGNGGNDIILANGGNDTIRHELAHGGHENVDGGAGTDTFNLTGTSAGEAYVVWTVAAYNAAHSGSTYTGTGEILITVGGSIVDELIRVEEIAITGGGGTDSLDIIGDFGTTSLTRSTITYQGGSGADTVNVSHRASNHAVVADGGPGTDSVTLGFAFNGGAGATYQKMLTSGTLTGVQITHTVGGQQVTDTFTNFENFTFADGTLTLAGLFEVPPVAQDGAASGDEDTLITGAVTASSTSALTYSLVTQAAHGKVTLQSNGTFSYAPDAEYSGADSFTFQASDGARLSNVGTESLTIKSVNDVPAFGGDRAITVAEGGSVVLTTADLTATDPDNTDTQLVFTVTATSHGSVLLNGVAAVSFTKADIAAGSVAFQHDGGEADGSFTVSLSDGNASPGSATVTATVNPHVNDAPVLGGDAAITVAEGGAVVLTTADLTATDPDNTDAQLVFTVTATSHGSVLLNGGAATSFTKADIAAGKVSFQHDGGEADGSFTVSLSDGSASGGSVTVAATVNPHVNDAPVPGGDAAITVAEGGAVVLTLSDLTATDPDNTDAQLVFTVTATQHGSVLRDGVAAASFTVADIAAGKVSFQHDGGELDGSFTVSLSDGSASGGSTTVAATVDPHVNDAPALGGDAAITVPEGGAVTLTIADLTATDPDNTDAQLVFTVTATQHGSVLLNGAAATSFTKADIAAAKVAFQHDGGELDGSFTVSLSDGSASGGSVTVAATVSPHVNDAPVIGGDGAITVAEGGGAVLTTADLTATDPDNTDTQLVFTVTGTSHGTVLLNGGAAASFTVADIAAGKVAFQHDGGEADGAFTVSLSDGSASGGSTTVAAIVNPHVNDAPVLGGDAAITVAEGGTVMVTTADLTATDPDNTDGELVFTVTATSHGAVLLNGNVVTSFTKADIVAGNVAFQHDGGELDGSFTVSLSDGQASGGSATVSATVNPHVNDAPVFGGDDAITVAEGGAVVLTTADLTATDPDNSDAQLVFTVTATSHGSVLLNGAAAASFTKSDIAAGRVSFQHDGGEADGSFTVSLSDGQASGGSVTVSATVDPHVNDAPVLGGDDAITVAEGGAVVLTLADLSATDPDNTDAQLVFAVTAASHGSVLLNGAAATSFTKADIAAGKVSFQHDGGELDGGFTVSLSDGQASGGSVTVSATVNPHVNDAPVLGGDDAITVAEGGAVILTTADLTATDPDNTDSELVFTVTATQHGTVLLNGVAATSFAKTDIAAGKVTFQHDGGEDDGSFTVALSDGSAAGGSATIHATVDPHVNDAPVVSGQAKLPAIVVNSGAHTITQAQLLANATDVDGPTLTAINLQIAKGLGTLADNHDGTWTYTPKVNDDTDVTFSYQVTDGIAAPVADTATLDITTAQSAPALGTSGNDTFTVVTGNTQYDGLGGTDTVIFDFKLVDATVTYAGNHIIIDGPSSHTVLSGIEVFRFTDGTVNDADGDRLVDDLYYYAHNHDVWTAGADADAHYHSIGWKEGRDPDAFFSTSTYLSENPSVKAAGVDPLVQFDQGGWKTGIDPSIAFDSAAYLAANPDVKAAGIDPLAHYLANGYEEGRTPIAPSVLLATNGFDYVYYLQHNPDVAAAHIDPLQHYENVGWKEGRNPNAFFDDAGYLATYADVKAAGINPLDHYNNVGWKEGRDPSVNFDTGDYLAHNPDVAAAHINPLIHFLQHGQFEGRSSYADGHWG